MLRLAVAHHLCVHVSSSRHGLPEVTDAATWESARNSNPQSKHHVRTDLHLLICGDRTQGYPQTHDQTCTPGIAPCESGICLLQDKVVLLERMDEWPLRVQLASVIKILVKIQSTTSADRSMLTGITSQVEKCGQEAELSILLSDHQA